MTATPPPTASSDPRFRLPSSRPGAKSASAKKALDRLLWSVVVPAAGALLILRTLLPRRLEGATGGALATLARVTEEHPLIVGIVLFFLIAETVRYWRDLLGGRRDAARATATASLAGLSGPGAPASPTFRLASRSTARPTFRIAGLSLARFAALLAVVAVAAFVLRASVVETYRVVSPSMLPTLNVGDRVLVNKLKYGVKLPFVGRRLGEQAPRRGDLVVFGASSTRITTGPQTLVKRVVGLPGDHVTFREGFAVINGWPVPSCDAGPYANVAGGVTVRGRIAVEFLEDKVYLTVRTPGEAAFAGYTVAPGEVFVVGDDRGMSTDSRLWNEGRGAGVPLGAINGGVSRTLLGTTPDGRLDLSPLFKSPGLDLREPGIDLRKTRERIATCLKTPPAATRPPTTGLLRER
jgi:signal peptidase I